MRTTLELQIPPRPGAALYPAGRIAYLPAYAFGIYLLRSLIWNVATIGIVLLLVALLTTGG